jgi:hypothetical protein
MFVLMNVVILHFFLEGPLDVSDAMRRFCISVVYTQLCSVVLIFSKLLCSILSIHSVPSRHHPQLIITCTLLLDPHNNHIPRTNPIIKHRLHPRLPHLLPLAQPTPPINHN